MVPYQAFYVALIQAGSRSRHPADDVVVREGPEDASQRRRMREGGGAENALEGKADNA